MPTMIPAALPKSRSDAARLTCFALLAAAGCVADLASKAWVFSWLGGPQSGELSIYWLVEGYVGIETALNHGALFGMGQGKVWFFTTMSFVALVGIGYWLLIKNALGDLWLTTTLGIISGGILGNLYDRLGLWNDSQIYAVRDWIRLSVGDHVWPNFNIADSLLVCGAAMLVLHSLTQPPPRTDP